MYCSCNTSFLGAFKKMFWYLLLSAFTAGLLHTVVMVTMKYFSYDVTVHVTINHASELEFPAVTICNNNPLRNSLWQDSNFILGESQNARRKRSASKCYR